MGIARDLKPGFFGSKPVATVFVPPVVDAQAGATTGVFAALNAGNLGSAPGATIVIRGPPGPDAISAVRGELASIDPHLTVLIRERCTSRSAKRIW